MYPIHQDITLSEEQKQIVLDYIAEIGFAIEGTSPSDYQVVSLAKYVGWNFQSEDLESYAVGLVCTKPGFEKHHTFIRMSHDQLMGIPNAQRLPVNDPVLANDSLRMQRWRDTPTGPSRTGIDSYHESDGTAPGADQDLNELECALDDIQAFYDAGKTASCEGQFDLNVDFGILLAGRYPRLKYFQQQQKLRQEQLNRLAGFEQRATEMITILEDLNLPSLETIKTPEERKHPQHN